MPDPTASGSLVSDLVVTVDDVAVAVTADQRVSVDGDQGRRGANGTGEPRGSVVGDPPGHATGDPTGEPARDPLGDPPPELVGGVEAVLAELEARSASTDGTAGSPLGYASAGLREDAGTLLRMFDAQAAARWLDVVARGLRLSGPSTRTRDAAGHEAGAAIALAVRPGDPAMLHHRSSAFFLARAEQAGHRDAVLEVATGLVAAGTGRGRGDPHTAYGHPDLAIVRTSVLGSHLPRAVGIAWSAGRQSRIPERKRAPLAWADDAVAVATFTDAVVNHSTATGAVNSACWASWHRIPMPLLLVCEDDAAATASPGSGNWVRAVFEGRAGLEYLQVDGADPIATIAAARWAAEVTRTGRRPVVLHVTCPRVGAGRPGSTGGTARAGRGGTGSADPLAAMARVLVDGGLLGPAEVRERWQAARDRVADAVRTAREAARPATVVQVMEGLAARRPRQIADRVGMAADEADRFRVFSGRLPEDEGPLTLAQTINRTLLDAGVADSRVLVLGADLAASREHGTTQGFRRLGASRVIDALTDERSVLGLALGAGVSGLLPVAEVQDVSGLHDAQDQLRGQAAMLRFLSRGRYRNPLVIRVPALADRVGSGVRLQIDHALGVLRDIPDLVIACPAHPSDAPPLLRTCLAAAEVDGTVSVVIEPVALYHERDMFTEGDGAWLAPYLPPTTWRMGHVPIGRAAVWGTGTDLTIATFGNGVRSCLQATARLATEGIGCRVVDLRWLAPLPLEDVLREASASGRLLVVDETRRTGGLAEGLVTAVLEGGFAGRVARLCAQDAFVPAGDAARLVLVGVEEIVSAGRDLAKLPAA